MAVGFTMEPSVRDQGKDRRRVPRTAGFRNGLPLPVLYVYRGTGADIYAGQYGDEFLDRP